MSDLSWADIVRLVHHRAQNRCEYCQTAQRVIGQAMHVEHIIPSAGDLLENLCLSCANCNLSKAQAISALDPLTGEMIALFNPRQDNWHEHFSWGDNGTILVGLTPSGRATIERLKINQARVVEARLIWVMAKVHPPD